eukprot:TRINITY_DN972_c0_g1_i1.p1 TRINITY_DN972_c0_g1~~TRINITY_DN972_c0_g1_i1.p1  ORF type:complete len:181 (-),score=61.66 TRINITY_DN972_c0_g1_i1:56-598(-)
MQASDKSIHSFESKLSSFRDGMLVTHNRNGQDIRARPMHLLKRDDDENLWLATSKGEKVHEIEQNDHVCMTLQNAGKWISITGKASIVSDVNKIKELWNEGLKIYFPNGPESPELVLIKINTIWAEFWDVSSATSKLAWAFQAGKAYLQGEKMTVDSAGDHQRLSLLGSHGGKAAINAAI